MNEPNPKYYTCITNIHKLPAQWISKRSRLKTERNKNYFCLYIFMQQRNRCMVKFLVFLRFDLIRSWAVWYIKRPLECFQFSFITICCFCIFIKMYIFVGAVAAAAAAAFRIVQYRIPFRCYYFICKFFSCLFSFTRRVVLFPSISKRMHKL